MPLHSSLGNKSKPPSGKKERETKKEKGRKEGKRKGKKEKERNGLFTCLPMFILRTHPPY